jgi:hypothetical protein
LSAEAACAPRFVTSVRWRTLSRAGNEISCRPSISPLKCLRPECGNAPNELTNRAKVRYTVRSQNAWPLSTSRYVHPMKAVLAFLDTELTDLVIPPDCSWSAWSQIGDQPVVLRRGHGSRPRRGHRRVRPERTAAPVWEDRRRRVQLCRTGRAPFIVPRRPGGGPAGRRVHRARLWLPARLRTCRSGHQGLRGARLGIDTAHVNRLELFRASAGDARTEREA